MSQFQTHDLFFLQTGIEHQVDEEMAAWIYRSRLQQTLDLIIKQQLRQRRQRAFKGQARGGIFTNDLLTEQPGKEVFEKGNTSCHSFGSRYLPLCAKLKLHQPIRKLFLGDTAHRRILTGKTTKHL